MRKHLWRSALLCGALLAVASLAAPAVAIDCVEAGAPCAILTDSTNTFIEITNVGTAPKILCHGRQGKDELGGICDEGFSVCVKDRKNEPEIAVLGDTAFGLIPAPEESCVPFVQLLVKTNTGTAVRTVFLEQTGNFEGTPVFDLDSQNLDLDGDGNADEPLPLGSLVTVVIENRPNTDCGRCIGVRTTIQHRVGTCKIWKTRKFFNVCSTPKTITAIREFERPCGCGVASALPGPGGSRTAIFRVTSTGEFITLAAGSSSGVPKTKAGSVDSPLPFVTEFFTCPPKSFINPLPSMDCEDNVNNLYLAVLLDYKPGGMTLKKNQETFVSFHIDFE